jgi:hypothetical protein
MSEVKPSSEDQKTHQEIAEQQSKKTVFLNTGTQLEEYTKIQEAKMVHRGSNGQKTVAFMSEILK